MPTLPQAGTGSVESVVSIIRMAVIGPISRLVGVRVAHLRTRVGARQEDVAQAAQQLGLAWTTSVVTQIETGRRNVSIEELMLLPTVLYRVGVPRLSFAELVASAVPVALTERVTVEPSDIRETIRGRSAPHLAPAFAAFVGGESDVLVDEATRKIALALGVNPVQVHEASLRLWGCSLAEKRDAELAAVISGGASRDTIRAKRGHITRRLLPQLRMSVWKALLAS